MSTSDGRSSQLDFLSSDFDALKALTTSHDIGPLPAPNAPIYDNLTWFVETEDGIFPRERVAKKSDTTATTSKAKARTSGRIPWKSSSGVDDLRPLDPETVEGSGSGTRVYRNTLINMDTAVGPLAFLKKCMDEKLRAKVSIRGAASIRGFCIGFVEAFDKHMNLVLKDVYETWKRPRNKHRKNISIEIADAEKCEKADDAENESANDSTFLHKYAENGTKVNPSSRNENACYPIARWIVKRRTKKKDVCERHVHQLLIRGEQVVCVMLER